MELKDKNFLFNKKKIEQIDSNTYLKDIEKANEILSKKLKHVVEETKQVLGELSNISTVTLKEEPEESFNLATQLAHNSAVENSIFFGGIFFLIFKILFDFI